MNIGLVFGMAFITWGVWVGGKRLRQCLAYFKTSPTEVPAQVHRALAAFMLVGFGFRLIGWPDWIWASVMGFGLTLGIASVCYDFTYLVSCAESAGLYAVLRHTACKVKQWYAVIGLLVALVSMMGIWFVEFKTETQTKWVGQLEQYLIAAGIGSTLAAVAAIWLWQVEKRTWQLISGELQNDNTATYAYVRTIMQANENRT